MAISLEAFRLGSGLITPMISALIDVYVKPKLEEHNRRKTAENELLRHSIANRFVEYLTRSVEKHNYINTLVFQNQPKSLDELYIPLRVGASRGLPLLIDHYHQDFIPLHQRVLLTDTAGMGKSTLLKFLFLSAIAEQSGIPVLIELRKLNPDRDIIKLLVEELSPIDEPLNPDFVLLLVKRGDFIFFLDGYDEIAPVDRSFVTGHLQEFALKAKENHFIITTRPESGAESFGNFRRFSIEPLRLSDAFSLIRKYDTDGRVADSLIEKLQGETLTHVKEFLENPLLVSLLFKSYSHKPTIPYRKDLFYRQVYDALFDEHDLTKPGHYTRDKQSNLDSESFHCVLRSLGYLTYKGAGVEYSKDELMAYLNKAKALSGITSFSVSDFLNDLLTAVPLFVRDGNLIRWNHRSLQEYFAAAFIWQDAKARQSDILLALYKSEEVGRHMNLLGLLYDMDYKSFRNVLIRETIKDFFDFCNRSYESIRSEVATPAELHRRRLLNYGRDYYIMFTQKHNGSLCKYPDYSALRYAATSASSRGFHAVKEFSPGGTSVEVVAAYSAGGLICRLLGEKQDDLVMSDFGEKFGLPEFMKQGKPAPPGRSPTGHPIPMSDDPNTVCNSKGWFDEITRIMGLCDPSAIHPEKARQFLAQLQIEENEQSRDDLLLGL